MHCIHEMVRIAEGIEAVQGRELTIDDIARLTLHLWRNYKGSYPPKA